jgi:RNA polymerase sigma-70 factor, ECF subfamily
VELFGFDPGYLERLASGDYDTEQHFCEYFGQFILLKLRSRRFSRHAMEDIRQETFLRVLRALRNGELRDAHSLGAFVNSVCRFVTLEHERAARQEMGVERAPEPRDESSDSEGDVLNEERRTVCRTVLQELSKRDRELLTAVFLEEALPLEICRRHKIQYSYLRVLLHRARRRFRQLIGKRPGYTHLDIR